MTNDLDFAEPLEGVDAVFIACLIPFIRFLTNQVVVVYAAKIASSPTMEGSLSLLTKTT